MSQIAVFIRLACMRRRAGAGIKESAAWAAGLLWRNHQATKQQRP